MPGLHKLHLHLPHDRISKLFRCSSHLREEKASAAPSSASAHVDELERRPVKVVPYLPEDVLLEVFHAVLRKHGRGALLPIMQTCKLWMVSAVAYRGLYRC
jgi:hypothetical protein